MSKRGQAAPANAAKPGEELPPDTPAGETEPEAPAAASPPAAAAPPPVDPPEPPAPAAPPKTAAEQAREDILARARERRAAEVAEGAADPQVQRLDEFAGGQPPAPHDSTVADDQPPAATTARAPAKAAAAQNSDGGEDGVKISVYGEEVTVSEDEVREAGIATLQKERAAEYRLQEASKTESRLRKYHQDLDAYRDQLQAMEKKIRAGQKLDATDVATATAPPSTGATVTVDDAKLADAARKAAEAIYRGDPSETAQALKSLLADVAQGRTATPPPVDVNAVAAAAADMVDERKEQRTAEERRTAVNKTFATEFKAVQDHPEAFLVAQARFNAMLADPSNEGRPWEELAREAGKAALHRYPELRPTPPSGGKGNEPPPAPAPGAVDDPLAQRRQLKRSTIVRPSSTSARAPAPQPQPVRSNKQFIADLRAARGLPR